MSRILWKPILTRLVEDHLLTFPWIANDKSSEIPVDGVVQYVEQALARQPWFYRAPVLLLTASVAVFNVFRRRPGLSPISRRLPGFSLLDRLVRNLAFLCVFDLHTPSPRPSVGVDRLLGGDWHQTHAVGTQVSCSVSPPKTPARKIFLGDEC